jgi:hypothetical protein
MLMFLRKVKASFRLGKVIFILTVLGYESLDSNMLDCASQLICQTPLSVDEIVSIIRAFLDKRKSYYKVGFSF